MIRMASVRTSRRLVPVLCLTVVGAATGADYSALAGTKLLLDRKNLPANQWVEWPVKGLVGNKVTNGGGLDRGLTGSPEGLLSCGNAEQGAVKRLKVTDGQWEDALALAAKPGPESQFSGWNYNWGPLWTGQTDDGQTVPVKNAHFHGLQSAYDPDRKVLVALTRGNTVEYDLRGKKCEIVKADPAPPSLTAASLCYDPVNREVVLATGGFSPVGGTGGTWLYDGAKKQWRQLQGAKEMEEVRSVLERARDRLLALRWLAWKNLEFRATGREKLLDERARGEALSRESTELAAEFKRLATLAEASTGKAERPYHKGCLSTAGKLLGKVAGSLAVLDAKLKAGAPDELEAVYRGQLAPLTELVEKAVAELVTTPEPRMSARLVYDSKNRMIVCFGGDRQDGQWGDTWVYHCEGRWWERRHPGAHPAPGTSRSVAFDEKNGVVVHLSSIMNSGAPVGWQMWSYDSGADAWKRLDIAMDPKALRDAFWLEYDPSAGCLVALAQDLARAWLLRLSLSTAPAAAAKDAPEASLVPIDGEFVLRDAAAVADLRTWKAAQDEWVKSVPANTWVEVPHRGTGRPNWGRTWSSLVYDPDRLQFYYREGGHGSYHGAVTDHYDLPTGRWFRSARREVPPWPMGNYFAWGRAFSGAPWCVHSYKYAVFYDPVTHRLLRTSNKAYADPTYHFSYDPDLGNWAWDPVRTPDSFRKGFNPVFGGRTNLVMVHAGKTDSEVALLTATGWQSITNAGVLPGTLYPAWEFQVSQYDPKRHRVLRMGPGKVPNELWILELAKPGAKWANAAPKTVPEGAPLPESGREMVYIPKHDVFLMPDGAKDKTMTEMCVYHPGENVWRRFRIATGAGTEAMARRLSGDRSNGMSYDPESDLCFFIGAANNPPPLYAFRYVPDVKSPVP